MSQEFDYAGLEGRLLSSSYTPQSGDAKYASMLRELRRIFEAHQEKGQSRGSSTTRVCTSGDWSKAVPLLAVSVEEKTD